MVIQNICLECLTLKIKALRNVGNFSPNEKCDIPEDLIHQPKMFFET